MSACCPSVGFPQLGPRKWLFLVEWEETAGGQRWLPLAEMPEGFDTPSWASREVLADFLELAEDYPIEKVVAFKWALATLTVKWEKLART